MPESLLSPSEIKLFGREFLELKLAFGEEKKETEEQAKRLEEAYKNIDGINETVKKISDALNLAGEHAEDFMARAKNGFKSNIRNNYIGTGEIVAESRLGANNFLRAQLVAANAGLARIYAFAYEGDIYFLPKPYIFLVHGPGKIVIEPNRLDISDDIKKIGVTVDRWGVVAKIDRFADDVRVWDYDKEDFSLRIDIVSGPLSEIALEPAMAGDSSTSRADMTSRANMALRANMAGSGGGGNDMAARANLAVRHRFTR